MTVAGVANTLAAKLVANKATMCFRYDKIPTESDELILNLLLLHRYQQNLGHIMKIIDFTVINITKNLGASFYVKQTDMFYWVQVIWP
jgi:hypothetical protein